MRVQRCNDVGTTESLELSTNMSKLLKAQGRTLPQTSVLISHLFTVFIYMLGTFNKVKALVVIGVFSCALRNSRRFVDSSMNH